MNPNFKKSLVLGAALFTAASAQAQVTITPLIEEGDMLAPLGVVTRIDNVDVNNSADWMVELDTDNADTAADNAVVFNGNLIHAERTSMGIPAPQNAVWRYDGTIDSMDINDNGDRLVLMRVEDIAAPMSATDGELLIWTNGSTGTSYVLLESLVTPNTADLDQTMSPVWDSISEVWQNNNNQLIVAGRSNTDGDDMLVLMEHDGAGTITSQTLFGIDGVNHATAFPPSNGVHNTPVQGFQVTKNRLAINDIGQKMFFVDDDHAVAGGDPLNDAHIYIDTFEIMAEDDISPDPMEPWGSMTTHEVDINNNGDWLMMASDDAFDYYLIRGDAAGNFVVLEEEGGEPPHLAGLGTGFVFTGTFSNMAIHLNDSGDYYFYGDWDDPDTNIDTGLFKNETLIVQEGVTMIGLDLIDTLTTSSDERAYSDSGRYVVSVFVKVGGIEGAYLIDTAGLSSTSYCFGDGGTAPGCTDCPCGNNATAGSPGGCLNGSGNSAELVVSGVPAVGNDSLRFEVLGANPTSFGILSSGDNQLPQMGACPVGSGITSPVLDGLRCMGGNALRHGTRATNANGDIGVTGAGWGPPSGPTGGLIAFNGFTAGQTRNFQCFYREDPALGCLTGQNTTNAISVTFQ